MSESDTAAEQVAPEPEPRHSVIGGVRATWWNAVVSLVVAIVAAHAPVAVYVVAGPQIEGTLAEPTVPRLVVMGALGAVSAWAQLTMVPWLRPGLGGGVTSPPVAISAVGTGLALWGMLLPIGVGVLPLVSALSLLACAYGPLARRGVFAATVAVSVAAWLLVDSGRLGAVVPALPLLTLVYPYLVFASVWAWDVVTRLDRARAVEADLAVTRERLRFASDLHDIQGHSLQVIALKAELAERLLGADTASAADQIAEVRHEAAAALAQTRELARGYRATSIEAELDNARDVLVAAGFDASTEVTEIPPDGETRSLFGRVLREATTNVLRHAGPGPVSIAVSRSPAAEHGPGEWRLRVVNALADGPVGERNGSGGTGLAGLTDRAERLDGRVETRFDDDDENAPRFVLTVAVPVRADEAVRS